MKTEELRKVLKDVKSMLRHEAFDKSVTLNATEDELTFFILGGEFDYKAKTEYSGEPFKIAVDANLLSAYINACPAEEVSFKYEERTLKIRSGMLKAKLETKDGRDEAVRDVEWLNVPGEVVQYFNTVSHAIDPASNDIRCRSVCIEVGEGVRVSATDGRRISVRGKAKDAKKFVVNATLFASALSCFANPTIEMSADTNWLKLHEDKNEIIIRSVDAPYIDLKRFITRRNDIELTLSVGNIDTICAIARATGDKLLIDADDKQVVLHCRAAEIPSVNETGGILKAAYDVRFISDAIKSIGGEVITLSCNNQNEPAYFTGTEEFDGVEMVLPITRVD